VRWRLALISGVPERSEPRQRRKKGALNPSTLSLPGQAKKKKLGGKGAAEGQGKGEREAEKVY
jgi:hypothetical protein